MGAVIEDAIAPPPSSPTPGLPAFLLDYPFETTRAVASLLRSGALESYPNVRLVRSPTPVARCLLVPWVASAGEPYHDFTDEADTRRRIDAILERVRRGGDA